jgi:integrase
MKTIPTSVRGFGCIYRPSYKDRHGNHQFSTIWWVKYQTDTGPVRKNLKTRDQQEAYEQLLAIAGRRISGEIKDARPETVRIGELLDLLLDHYKRKRTFYDVECRVRKRLRPEFGEVRVRDLRRAHLDSFVSKLESEKLTPATINRHLSNLHRALDLGRDHELVTLIPKFPWMDESENVRQGFMDRDTYQAFRDELGKTAVHAQLAFVIAYHVGMRVGEILGLKWDQIDLKAGLIRLEPTQTKNRRARVAPIYGEMGAFLEMANARRENECALCPWLIAFEGKRVKSIKTTWGRVRTRLGLKDSLFHDLRRTALSNMDEAGIRRSTAMSISGHKTESAYKRYLIGSERRVVAAGRIMEKFLATPRRLESQKEVKQ